MQNERVVKADAPFSRLVVKQTIMPLSIETLLEGVENNQTTIMFNYRGQFTEKILRNSTDGDLYRFEQAMEKYPPIYKDDFIDKRVCQPRSFFSVTSNIKKRFDFEICFANIYTFKLSGGRRIRRERFT